MEDRSIHQLYREACYGAGANARNLARFALENEAAARGTAVLRMLEDLTLDVGAYFATAPITREIKPGN